MVVNWQTVHAVKAMTQALADTGDLAPALADDAFGEHGKVGLDPGPLREFSERPGHQLLDRVDRRGVEVGRQFPNDLVDARSRL